MTNQTTKHGGAHRPPAVAEVCEVIESGKVTSINITSTGSCWIPNEAKPITADGPKSAATHGGARKGAGRPPTHTTEHRVRLPADVVSLLTALGDGRLSKGIVMAARSLKVGDA